MSKKTAATTSGDLLHAHAKVQCMPVLPAGWNERPNLLTATCWSIGSNPPFLQITSTANMLVCPAESSSMYPTPCAAMPATQSDTHVHDQCRSSERR